MDSMRAVWAFIARDWSSLPKLAVLVAAIVFFVTQIVAFGEAVVKLVRGTRLALAFASGAMAAMVRAIGSAVRSVNDILLALLVRLLSAGSPPKPPTSPTPPTPPGTPPPPRHRARCTDAGDAGSRLGGVGQVFGDGAFAFG